MREDYLGSLDPLSPWRRKCLKFLTAGQVFTHREYVQASDELWKHTNNMSITAVCRPSTCSQHMQIINHFFGSHIIYDSQYQQNAKNPGHHACIQRLILNRLNLYAMLNHLNLSPRQDLQYCLKQHFFPQLKDRLFFIYSRRSRNVGCALFAKHIIKSCKACLIFKVLAIQANGTGQE